jgi:Reverse transcriptase (RNA-dependent DNA polymerase)
MKLYEKVLLYRLTKWTTAENIINSLQTGFQPGFATIDQANLLYAVLVYRKSKGLDTCLAFLDIQKAFPSADHTLLWQRLLAEKLSPNDTNLLKLLCTDCFSKIKFQQNSTTDKVHINIGVKEGAVLSPLEFVLFLNEQNMQELANMLGIIDSYLNKYRLRLSTPKCKLVIVRKTIKAAINPIPPNVEIHLSTYEEPIKEFSECKYLGFIIQNNLKWNSMAKERLRKAYTFLNRIKMHKRQCHNISLIAAKRLYVTYGRPLLEYGIALWAEATNVTDNIEIAQNKMGKWQKGVGIYG